MQGAGAVQQQAVEQRQAAKQWIKPKEHQVKINWDAALNVSNHSTDLGGLIRDSKGDVLLAFCSNLGTLIEPYMAEALALRKAMVLCWELQFHTALFEGDCLQLISEAISSKILGNEIHPIIYDIRTFLKQAPGWSTQFCCREANRATHLLAKIACNNVEERVWMEDCPSLVDVITLEEQLCNSVMDE